MKKKILITLSAILWVAACLANESVLVINPTSRPVPVIATGGLSSTATQKTGASGNVANGSAAASLAAAASKTNYLTGFQCTASGATGALVVNVTVTGVITGTMTYSFVFPAGVTAQATPLIVTFPTPVKASATNTAITVTLPASGAGGTNAAVNVQGFDL